VTIEDMIVCQEIFHCVYKSLWAGRLLEIDRGIEGALSQRLSFIRKKNENHLQNVESTGKTALNSTALEWIFCKYLSSPPGQQKNPNAPLSIARDVRGTLDRAQLQL
jgi:hypothetical protein